MGILQSNELHLVALWQPRHFGTLLVPDLQQDTGISDNT